MKAGKRLGMALGIATLILAAAPARAQETPPPEVAPPEPIGPRELENFTVNGAVTREAEPPAQAPATVPRAAPQPTARDTRPSPRPADNSAATPAGRARESSPSTASARPPIGLNSAPTTVPTSAPPFRPSASVTVPLPPLEGQMASPAADVTAAPDEGNLASRALLAQWPWLLAMLAVALGGLVLWRSRSRPTYAGWSQGDEFAASPADALVAPQPARPPAARPASQATLPPAAPPPRAAAPPPSFFPKPPAGVVSTGLRPRLELQFNPLQCTIDGEQLIVEFELELFNNGSAPARAILVEVSLFNAGPTQDQALGAYFDNPVGEGDRIALIAPLKRMVFRSPVVAPRDKVQLFKVEDREVFVPLIAFNALYSWSNGDAQTSMAFMLGRDTKSDKLAPFRADLGPRQYRNLGARQLPNVVQS